jgi:hypothetical protein
VQGFGVSEIKDKGNWPLKHTYTTEQGSKYVSIVYTYILIETPFLPTVHIQKHFLSTISSIHKESAFFASSILP